MPGHSDISKLPGAIFIPLHIVRTWNLVLCTSCWPADGQRCIWSLVGVCGACAPKIHPDSRHLTTGRISSQSDPNSHLAHLRRKEKDERDCWPPHLHLSSTMDEDNYGYGLRHQRQAFILLHSTPTVLPFPLQAAPAPSSSRSDLHGRRRPLHFFHTGVASCPMRPWAAIFRDQMASREDKLRL
jgi:hypothetical protein